MSATNFEYGFKKLRCFEQIKKAIFREAVKSDDILCKHQRHRNAQFRNSYSFADAFVYREEFEEKTKVSFRAG